MDKIRFSTNWNNKLNCKSFTTFRPHNSKYRQGFMYEIWLKQELKGYAECMAIKTMPLNKVTPFIAYIDTGYSVEEFRQMVQTMYKNKFDVDKARFDFVLLKYTK